MTGFRASEEVDAALSVVEKVGSEMEPDIYNKCMVSLAYEYLCCGEQQKGLVLISKVPISYYENVQLQQMNEDEMYRDLVILLSYRLVHMGLVAGSDELAVPTMPMARA